MVYKVHDGCCVCDPQTSAKLEQNEMSELSTLTENSESSAWDMPTQPLLIP